MTHLQIHPMEPEDEIELHCDVEILSTVNGVPSLRVRLNGKTAWLPEGFIDYQEELEAGVPNVLYVPVSIARDAGLV